MTQKILLFANPIAGRGRGQNLAKRLARRLRDVGYSVAAHLVRADTVDAAAFEGPARAAIVIGGDGTLRTVAQRLLTEAAARHREPTPILIIPMGTANLMGQHLGMQWLDETIEAAVVDAIRLHKVVRCDAARANGQLMLLVAGVGIDGSIVHELDRVRSGPIHLMSYAFPALMALKDYRYPSLKVTVDGKTVFDHAPAMAFVGNIAEYGTGFPILPRARPDDGLLDICVIPCSSPMELMQHLLNAADESHLHDDEVVYITGKSIRIESDTPVPVQIDGEAAGHSPLLIDLLPTKVPFMVQR